MFVRSLICSALVLAAAPAFAQSVSGSAFYRERIALPPDAVFEATLEDVSRADAPAVVLGSSRLEPAGQPPFRFKIAYEISQVQPGHRYSVRARVTRDGSLLFTTDRSYPVLAGAPDKNLKLLLRAVAKPVAVAPPTLQDTRWNLLPEKPAAASDAGSRTATPHIILSSQDKRVGGSGGCNRLMGAYELEGDTLRFGSLAATMMACLGGMEEEARLTAALRNVARWQIEGRQLRLLDEAGQVLLRFEAATAAVPKTPGR